MTCKVMMVFRALGYYLSSTILVTLSIDRYGVVSRVLPLLVLVLLRYLVVRNPFRTLHYGKQRRLARVMVLCCWVVSIILSFPQAIMFRKLKHPYLEFYQCTTKGVVEAYSDIVAENGKRKYSFYGLDPVKVYNIYHFSFLFFVYFLPLFCLVISYVIIIKLIKR